MNIPDIRALTKTELDAVTGGNPPGGSKGGGSGSSGDRNGTIDPWKSGGTPTTSTSSNATINPFGSKAPPSWIKHGPFRIGMH